MGFMLFIISSMGEGAGVGNDSIRISYSHGILNNDGLGVVRWRSDSSVIVLPAGGSSKTLRTRTRRPGDIQSSTVRVDCDYCHRRRTKRSWSDIQGRDAVDGSRRSFSMV
jgi:hypothetical protein